MRWSSHLCYKPSQNVFLWPAIVFNLSSRQSNWYHINVSYPVLLRMLVKKLICTMLKNCAEVKDWGISNVSVINCLHRFLYWICPADIFKHLMDDTLRSKSDKETRPHITALSTSVLPRITYLSNKAGTARAGWRVGVACSERYISHP